MTWDRTFEGQQDRLMEAIDDAVAFVEGQGASPQALYQVRFVLEELGTNILKYGHDDEAIHPVRVQVELTPERIRVHLEDDGHAFDPTGTPDPDTAAPLEERTPGGLGLMLIRKLVQRFAYERQGGVNRSIVDIARRA